MARPTTWIRRRWTGSASVRYRLSRPGIGRRHLELIESAITEARDPRRGELAVRLAYAFAAAEAASGGADRSWRRRRPH